MRAQAFLPNEKRYFFFHDRAPDVEWLKRWVSVTEPVPSRFYYLASYVISLDMSTERAVFIKDSGSGRNGGEVAEEAMVPIALNAINLIKKSKKSTTVTTLLGSI